MPVASSLTVLVVDDQMTIRSLVRSGLQQIGISNVEEAADGEQGLRNLIARPATLVITDFNMPKLDGLGLLRALLDAGWDINSQDAQGCTVLGKLLK